MEAATSHNAVPELFSNLKFWLSHKVPQRARFVNDIRVSARKSRASKNRFLNLTADQWRRGCDIGEECGYLDCRSCKEGGSSRKVSIECGCFQRLPMLKMHSYSYKYIELSLRNGRLEDLSNHAAGPPAGTVRSVGSVVQPARSTRQKYSAEDDRILVEWVKTHPQSRGGTEGAEIYKALEEKVCCFVRDGFGFR